MPKEDTQFKPGNKGREPGATNKTSMQLREMITDFLETNFEKVTTDFEQMKPKDRAKIYCDLLQYGLPRLQTVQLDTVKHREVTLRIIRDKNL